ncbi:uncharacterized protein LOC122265138 isoform X2 [Penaeus japonicus]|uniref:uncharacterized protein LOC122265138 isoform X1 n=1 Tax=Penaeus japonicus TaxID=27405 RepID=UPI001C7130B6|nr:uncharacterized protein LOC122265138 isoform X1 [Penaeus japonicus]XP_042890212.1 uncharacterized protein LOC122265138 isoform X2 [Penaeus japonicus]
MAFLNKYLIIFAVALSTPSCSAGKDFDRLEFIENRVLDFAANISASNLLEMVEALLSNDQGGQEVSRLVLEGVALGFQQKNPSAILFRFLDQLSLRLSPELSASLGELKEQVFEARSLEGVLRLLDLQQVSRTLGNLGYDLDQVSKLFQDFGLDLGQISKLFQDSGQISDLFKRYGLDLDQILPILQNGDADFSSLSDLVSGLNYNAILKTFLNSSLSSSLSSSTSSSSSSSSSSKRPDKTLRLFRPLLTSFLRENEIDLDPDAVLEVVSPFLKVEMLTQLAPLVAMATRGMSGQKKNNSGGRGSGKRSEEAGLGQLGSILGGLGALVGGGGGGGGGAAGGMDINTMLNLASMFMGGREEERGKGRRRGGGGGIEKTKTKNKNKENENNTKKKMEEEKRGGSGLDFAKMASLVGKIARENELDAGAILDFSARLLNPEGGKKKRRKEEGGGGIKRGGEEERMRRETKAKEEEERKRQELKKRMAEEEEELEAKKKKKEEEEKRKKKEAEDKKKREEEERKRTKKTKKNTSLLEIFEPILLSMRKDQQCDQKVRQFVTFGKAFLGQKLGSLGHPAQYLPHLLSLAQSAGASSLLPKDLDLETLGKNLADWAGGSNLHDLLDSLEENPDFGQILVASLTPHVTSLSLLLASPATQDSLYESLIPRAQSLLASYGLKGLTIQNFPEKLGPLIGLFTRGWDLGFRPTAYLVPLKDYLQGFQSWAKEALQEIRNLKESEVNQRVAKALNDDVIKTILDVRRAVTSQEAAVTSQEACLPQRLCEVTKGHDPGSLKMTVARVYGVTMATGRALAVSETSQILLAVVQALSGSHGDCKISFPGDCDRDEGFEEDLKVDLGLMDLKYDHQEL